MFLHPVGITQVTLLSGTTSLIDKDQSDGSHQIGADTLREVTGGVFWVPEPRTT